MKESDSEYEKEQDSFYEGVKKRIQGIVAEFAEEDKLKKTIVVPAVFDKLLNRKIRGDLLRFYDTDIDYSKLVVGFAMIGIAELTSEGLIGKIADDLDLLDAFDVARMKKDTEDKP